MAARFVPAIVRIAARVREGVILAERVVKQRLMADVLAGWLRERRFATTLFGQVCRIYLITSHFGNLTEQKKL